MTASLPSAAAAAVAADPTVAYINSELNNKVDLSDVSTVETPDTIAKRNGSGRLVAADPASGATDKTLTTANWISQTGDSSPNNLIHKTGNETKSGTFSLPGRLIINRTVDTWRQIDCYSEVPKTQAPANILRYGFRIYGPDGDIAFLLLERRTDGKFALVLSGNPIINGVPTWRTTTIAVLG